MNITKFLNVGRVIKIKDGKNDWGYGYLINFHKRERNNKKKSEEDATFFIADIMVYCSKDPHTDSYKPCKLNDEGEMLVLPFSLTCICEITAIKISEMPTDLTN